MKHLLRTFTLTAVVIMAALSVTSCDDDDSPWWGSGNAYYDSNLQGTWQLWQINGSVVSPGDTNYMTFYSGGKGYYYYLNAGRPMTERIKWVCNAGYNRDTLSVRYASGQLSTMNYWFNSDATYLYLNWTTSAMQQMTYVYVYKGNITPW